MVVVNGYFPRLSLKELAATVLSVLGRGAAEELRVHTLQVSNPLFKFRNNAQFADQFAASIRHVALIGPN